MAHPHGNTPTSRMSSPTEHVHSVQFDLEKDRDRFSTGGRRPSIQSDPDGLRPGYPSPILTRRRTRSGTANSRISMKTVDASPLRPNWHPGQEPGLDPSKPNGGRPQPPIHEECQITVVDFGEGEDDLMMHDFDNAGLIKFIQQKQEDWIKCRWINVNGLSWDVMQALGKHKKLHRLAIEDMTNTNNRTKADWYTDHTYMVLTLQKLVHLHSDKDSDSESDDDTSVRGPRKKRGRFSKAFHKAFSGHKATGRYDEKERKENKEGDVEVPTNGFVTGHTDGVTGAAPQKLRTLQRYNFGGNAERMAYMEKHSPLTRKGLAVSAEQVSIFITDDNTVISFFESSAEDIEKPILHRLSTSDTILRRSCDASMLVQAIMDACIDLATLVSAEYKGLIGELELDVLTEPSIKHTTSLYILTSEITIMRGFVSPIINLINALRDHKNNAVITGIGGRGDGKQASTGVKISPMAQTYLGDVEDHIILITDDFDSMRRSCDNMIDLIFNTISAYQNESMKQLTIVTIIFLPLSFLTGYFGMNFTSFPSTYHNESYFWIIALPVAFAVILFLMRDMIKWSFDRLLQRRGISRSRKGRLQREAQAQLKRT
ncbi:Cobalt magnesium transport [Hyphodiscus hymeniophilus]|uniref:Cobalt magnesium transport n=1 Tax=Hyphodiscus hymeniophilus TaxID=353542 RepID=A0A9P7AWV9_9HELO|nr:Cobalt magnesium transport [Hyphodiscus hymeniophilus]